MAGTYQDWLIANIPGLRQRMQAAPQAPVVTPAQAFNAMLASRVIQPGTGPVQTPTQPNIAGDRYPVGPAARVAPMPNYRPAIAGPPIDYGGGGGGVTANDILGQRGPVVVGPQYQQPVAVPMTPEDVVAETEKKKLIAAAVIARMIAQSGQSMAPPVNQQVSGPVPQGAPAQSQSAPSGELIRSLNQRGPVQGEEGIAFTGVPEIDQRIAQQELYAMRQPTQEEVNPTYAPPGPSLRPEGVVPQWDEIKRFEENTQLPTTDTPPLYTEDQQALVDSYVKIKTEDAVREYEVAGANLNSAQMDLHDATINYQNDPSPENELLYNRALNAVSVAEFNYNRAKESYEPQQLEPVVNVALPAINLIDKPRQMVVTEMGANAYDVASGKKDDWSAEWASVAIGNWKIPGMDGTSMARDFEAWAEDPANWQAIRNASENGFQAGLDKPKFTGGRAVWELYINSAGLGYKTVMDLVLDPLTLLPLAGRVGKATDVLGRAAIGRGQTALGATERTVGGVLMAPQRIMDVTADLPFNLAGKAATGLAGVIDERVLAPLRRLATDTESQANIAARETTSEALSPYASRRKNYPEAPEPPPASGETPNPPGSGGWYTVSKKGNQRIIVDPEGNTHSVHTVDKPNYFNENQVTKIRADLNRQLRRERAENAGWSVPKEDQGWMDPYAESYDTRPEAVNELHWYGNEVGVLSRDPFNRPATNAFVETYYDSGIAKSYMDDMEAISKKGGRDDFLPEKAYLRATHFADFVVPIWRDTIQKELGLEPPVYRFRYGDALDSKIVAEFTGVGEKGTPSIANAIEHAIYNPNVEQSAMARRYLFESNLMVDIPDRGRVPTRTIARELEGLRAKLYGEESLSQTKSAVASRKARAKRAQEPVPNEAALIDIGIPPAQAAPSASAPVASTMPDPPAPMASVLPPAPTVEQASRVIEAAKAKKPRKAATMKPAVSVLDLPDEKAIIRTIADGGNRSGTVRAFTPSKRRITEAQAGDLNVWSGTTANTGTPAARIEKAVLGDKTTWTVKSGDGKAIGQADSVRDAIAVADAWASENMPPMGGKPVGVVSPQFLKNAELEKRVRSQAFAGQTEGPGVADWALPRDTSGNLIDTVPARMLADGALTMDQYDALVRTVNWNGKETPLWQVFDDVITKVDGDAHAAIEMINGKIHPFNQIPFKELSKLKKAARVYMKTITALREMMQYNIANGAAKAIADQIGNSYTLMVTGRADEALKMWNPHTARAFITAERGSLERFRGLSEVQNLHKYGIEAPHSVTNLHIGRSETGTGDMVLRDVTNKWGGKITGSAYGIFANKLIRDIRNALDRNARFTLFKGEFDSAIRDSRIRFYEVVRTRATKLGKNADEWERSARGLGDAFSDEDVLRVLGDQRLARDWRAMVMESRRRGEASVNKRLFSYRQTKADEALRSVVFFHYWQTRALYLHTRTALENPYLLNAYVNAWDGMQQAAEDGNLPPALRSYLKYMTGAGGWYALLNPLGVLVPFDMLLGEAGGDETTMDWLRRHGAFFNPLVEGALAALGLTNRVPDITSTRAVRRAFKAMFNFGNTHGMDWAIPDFIAKPNTFVSDPFEAWTYNLFERANEKIGLFEKDFWGTESYDLDVIRSVLIRVAEESFGGPMAEWTPEQHEEFESAYDDIQLHRDGNDLADDALEQWSEAQAGGTLASVVFPGGVRMRYEPRDEDITLSKGEPSPEQQAARNNRDVATGGSAADIKLDRLNDEYHALGNVRQKALAKGYNDIVNINRRARSETQYANDVGVSVGGKFYTVSEVAALDDDQRKDLAKEWVASHNGTEELYAYWDKRDAWVQEHPEFAAYEGEGGYKDIIYDYAGGVRQYRLDRAAGNPNFKQEMEDRREYLIEQGVDKSVVEEELDSWALSLAGYKAAQGIKDYVYDADPKSTGDQATVDTIVRSLSGNQESGGGGYTGKKSTAEKLNADIKTYQTDMKVVEGLLAQYNIDKSALTSSNPYIVDTLQGLFGDLMPKKTKLMRQYEEWAMYQRKAGADDSVEAFAAYLDLLAEDAAA